MNEILLGRLVRNLVTLERVANGVVAGTENRLNRLIADVSADLQRIDPTSPPQHTYRKARLEEFLAAARERIREYVVREEAAMRSNLAVIGRAQAKFAENTLVATLGDAASRVYGTPITQSRIRAILTSDPFQGRLLREHIQRLGANTYARLRDQVRMGMIGEESIGDIVRRIRGRMVGLRNVDRETLDPVPAGTENSIKVPHFSGGVVDASTREAEALVRTAVTHVSNEGLLGTYKENDKLLSGVGFAAFLDDRTTVLCLSLDGTVWPVGSSEIRVPGRDTHWNCRSVLVPVVDWKALGMTPPPEPTRAARDLSDVSAEDLQRKVSARRRTGDLGGIEQIPSSVRAEEWLRGQPAAVQDKVLGRTRAQLFRSGKLSLADLVRRDGSIIPLRDLDAAAA